MQSQHNDHRSYAPRGPSVEVSDSEAYDLSALGRADSRSPLHTPQSQHVGAQGEWSDSETARRVEATRGRPSLMSNSRLSASSWCATDCALPARPVHSSAICAIWQSRSLPSFPLHRYRSTRSSGRPALHFDSLERRVSLVGSSIPSCLAQPLRCQHPEQQSQKAVVFPPHARRHWKRPRDALG